jgi:hypothetical protein
MHDITRALSEHPLAAMTVCFVLLLVLYVIGKKLIKLALVMLIVALAIGGYQYFQYPDQRPADVREALEKAREGTGRAVEQGKEAVEKGREFIDKGKDAVDKGREIAHAGKSLLDRLVERGRAVIDKGEKALREIGKIFSEGDGDDKKRPHVRL